MRTLYICYFGLREPLVQTQVLPYLRQLSRNGIAVSLLTFEPDKKRSWPAAEEQEWKTRLATDGITWTSLAYHKRPSLPATLYDILVGILHILRLSRQRRIDFLHARNHVPAVMGWLAKRITGSKLIFDIRGFFPEEYVDAGVWPAGGFLYRLTKAVEKKLFRVSDGLVVLTEKARTILTTSDTEGNFTTKPLAVIPCCVDFARFGDVAASDRDKFRDELGLTGRRVIVYVGALGGWYLTDEMAEFLATAHTQDQSTFSLILTQSRPELMAEKLKSLGVAERDFLIRQVSPSEVPKYLTAADVALSFIKTCYSKQSSSPTKIAEYLASGLPVISNSGIGDLDEVIETDRVGVIVRELNRAGYQAALAAVEQLLTEPDLATRCRASALKRFDLAAVGGVRYRRLYHQLLSPAQGEMAIGNAAEGTEFSATNGRR